MFHRKSCRVVRKPVPNRRESFRCPRSTWSSGTIWLEARVLLSASPLSPSVMSGAAPIAIGSAVSGNLAVGGGDFYEIQPGSDGRLIAQTHAVSDGLQLRLSIYDGQGNLLVQSDGQSSGRLDPLIDQHVAAGADFLEVQSLSGSGTYSLSTSLIPSSDPFQSLVLPPNFQGTGYAPIAAGDFTNNGILDIVAPDGVHLGTGDGTFQAPSATGALADPTLSPSAIAVGEFNGDHNLDVAVALAGTDSISISLGNGDGTFQPASMYGLPIAGAPDAIVAGDFTGNGITDLAVAVAGTGGATDDVVVLMGNGDGTFTALAPIPVGLGPVSIAAGDFAHDGLIDLAVADINSGDVTILSNQGGGNFTATQTIVLPPGSTPTSIVAGDFGTGNLDLAVTDSSTSAVDILRGNGHGTFQTQPVTTIGVGYNPFSIVAGDFGNGHLDLAVADANSNDVSVLLGNGDETFQAARQMATGSGPIALVAGDFNGDGRLDVATGDYYTNEITVLLGKGDGSFDEPPANAVGNSAAALATGDFTGNGNLGVAVVNQGSDSVTILPGNGDGTFQQPLTVTLPQGSGATSIVAADFNNDGRTDLAVTDSSLNEVSILLGNGDGTFQSSTIPVTGGPYAIAAGDFGNGHIDLAVVDRSFSTITILMGNGDGTFRSLKPIQLGDPNNPPFPDAIVVGNFNGDKNLDLAVAEPFTDSVTVLLGNGDGTFNQGSTISFGESFPFVPQNIALATGDFRNNGLTDLAVVSSNFYYGDTLDVLLGNGDGTFQAPQGPTAISLGSGVYPIGIVAGHFTNNGILDLATADSSGGGTDDYSVYLGNGDGTFQAPTQFTLGGTGYSTALVTGDFAGNGRTDLAITQTSPDNVYVRLSNGDGSFSSPSVIDLVRPETPLVADLNGDGAPDVSVVDAAGNILYRAGRPGEPGSFAPPVTVNPGDPSRAIAFVSTDLGSLLASVDANDDFISFFALRSTGFVKVSYLATGSQPAQILSADLSGDGQSDLIVRNAGDGTISVFRANGTGWFLPRIDLPVGLGASDVQVADLQQNGRLDIVYTDRLAGEVGVIENLGGGLFASPVLYRAGPGPYGVTGTANPSPVSSLEGTTSVAVGTFTTGGFPSLVALDPGSNTFGLLSGLGGDRFSNPTSFPTSTTGLVVRAIDFNGNGLTGLAILSPDGLFIYRSDGQGGFLPPAELNVGFEPNGLTVADLNGDGKPDLLVSNPLGDVLVLVGNGDGTFQPVQNLDQQVALGVYAPNGNTPAAFIFADQLTDQLVVQTVGGVTSVLGDASTGLVSPGAVKLADLNNNGILDLIVANSGSNNVLVYPGLGNGAFAPALNNGHGFFTGTNPAGITVADVNGDGRPDLIIANKGSNDVSILINVKVGNSFTFVPGPRLQAGVGPVSTVVADVFGNGVSDLVVANSGSNNVWLLQGIGNGFFNDQNPTIYSVGTNPDALFVGQFTGGSGQELVTVNSGSNNLTLISSLGSGSPQMQSISSGGVDPIAAFAVDLTGNGVDSLVVANNGDGHISLLTAGDNGLALSSVLSSSGLPNPSGLALASFGGGNLEFYATTEGEQSATLLGFQLEESGAGAVSSLSSAISPGGSAQLLSLNETSLALIGTLLTITLDSQSESEQSAEGSAAQVASAGPGAAGQSLVGPNHPSEEAEDFADFSAPPAANAATALSWARYVTGVDQAIEKLRNEADHRLLQEEQPAKAQEPGTTLLEEDGGARQTDSATSLDLEPTVSGASHRSETGPDRWDVIDAAIGSLGQEEATSYRSLLPITVGSTVTRSTTPVSQLVELNGREQRFPRLDDDPSQRVEIQVSRAAALAAILATAGKVLESSRSKRSVPRLAAGSSPAHEASWKGMSRRGGHPGNHESDRCQSRRASTPRKKW
ncbi:MAG: beta strand repeat-containing protein [Isosphaerales bacterium]